MPESSKGYGGGGDVSELQAIEQRSNQIVDEVKIIMATAHTLFQLRINAKINECLSHSVAGEYTTDARPC